MPKVIFIVITFLSVIRKSLDLLRTNNEIKMKIITFVYGNIELIEIAKLRIYTVSLVNINE